MPRRSKSRYPPVTVCVLTYNGAPTIREVITGILGQTVPVKQILVVDSTSADSTVEVVEETMRLAGFPGLLRLVTLPKEEFHHARTRDLALSKCRTRFAVLLVQDAVPADDRWLEALLAPFSVKGERKVAASCSRILPRLEAHLLAQRDTVMDPRASSRVRVFTGDTMRECTYHHVSACVKRSAWKKISFSAAYEAALHGVEDVPPGFGEDICWALEMCASGRKIAFMPESVVLHSHSYPVREVFLRERRDSRLRTALGFRGRRFLASVPLHVVHNATQDAGFVLFARSTIGERMRSVARSIPYRTAQALGQWLGTREGRR